MSPLLLVHVCGGTLGLVSGTAAMSFRKGSRWHALAGRVFVFSMLTMAAAAVYLAIVNAQPGNIGGGIFTFYLILTAWLTARPTDGQTSNLNWAAFLIPLALGIFTGVSGFEKMRSLGPPKDGVPAGMNFFMGCIMLLAAVGDVRMLLRRGVLGQSASHDISGECALDCLLPQGRFFWGPQTVH